MSSDNGNGEELSHSCLPFLNSPPGFKQGWECGSVWGMMNVGCAVISGGFFPENEAMLRLIAHEAGYIVERDGDQPGYVFLTFSRRTN